MENELKVMLTECRHGKPLVSLCNLHLLNVDMTPEQLRKLADALNATATLCEARPLDGKHLMQVPFTFSLVGSMPPQKISKKQLAPHEMILPMTAQQLKALTPNLAERRQLRRQAIRMAASTGDREAAEAWLTSKLCLLDEQQLPAILEEIGLH